MTSAQKPVGGKVDYNNLRVGDVVTTHEAMTIYRNNKADGKALPGWEWRIVGVDRHPISKAATYEVTSHTAPGMYHRLLKPRHIAQMLERGAT
jgi:hypothetical protein